MKQRICQFLTTSLTVLLLSTCYNERKFNSDEWKTKGLDWYMTDFREKMVNDLIQSDTLIGMSTEQVRELLGKPDFKNETTYNYLIREKYGTDVDPDYISYLIIVIGADGQVISCRIKK